MRFKFREDQKRAIVSRCATPNPATHPNPRPVRWGRARALMHRAVACRLLQRAACHEAYGVAHTAALIQRTKGGKPYLAARPDTALEGTPDPGPNWNFNVSHEGHYVVLAAEPLLLCGVDVAAPDQSRVRGKPRPLEEHFATMKD